ncbi:hypothetical protein FF36_03482 [Frankia torreyi]|uniref:Uncharacterized protein n=1 Tax=Frankia torreyi TaxID=1856 RepID=A0A0D8BE45_9ACTN|nr:hypothetical protein FF36_03482 [Frankia torreyi]KQM04364.1 hypothetical protein FF86_102757 [Frankia sp. CpI1-P]
MATRGTLRACRGAERWQRGYPDGTSPDPARAVAGRAAAGERLGRAARRDAGQGLIETTNGQLPDAVVDFGSVGAAKTTRFTVPCTFGSR